MSPERTARKLLLEEHWMEYVRRCYFAPVDTIEFEEMTIYPEQIQLVQIVRKPKKKKLATPPIKIPVSPNKFILTGKDLVAAAWKKISSKAAQNQRVI